MKGEASRWACQQDKEDFDQEMLIKEMLGDVIEFKAISKKGKVRPHYNANCIGDTRDELLAAEAPQEEEKDDIDIDSMLKESLLILGLSEEVTKWSAKILKSSITGNNELSKQSEINFELETL